MGFVIIILLIVTAILVGLIVLYVTVRAILEYRADQKRQAELYTAMLRSRYDSRK